MADDDMGNGTMAVERQEISQMVKCRMASLGLPLEDYGGHGNMFIISKYHFVTEFYVIHKNYLFEFPTCRFFIE